MRTGTTRCRVCGREVRCDDIENYTNACGNCSSLYNNVHELNLPRPSATYGITRYSIVLSPDEWAKYMQNAYALARKEITKEQFLKNRQAITDELVKKAEARIEEYNRKKTEEEEAEDRREHPEKYLPDDIFY